MIELRCCKCKKLNSSWFSKNRTYVRDDYLCVACVAFNKIAMILADLEVTSRQILSNPDNRKRLNRKRKYNQC